MSEDTISDADKASITQATEQIKALNTLSKSFGKSLSDAFATGIVQGKKFEDVMKSLGQKFAEFGLKAAFKPIESSITGLFDQLMKSTVGQTLSLTGATGSGFNFSTMFSGASTASSSVTPFAEGGVVAAPSYFPLGGNLGVAGERGTEAIMPLARSSDGRLGVVGAGGGSTAVTVNISTPDAESFRRSDAQVSSALARAVARGQRGL